MINDTPLIHGHFGTKLADIITIWVDKLVASLPNLLINCKSIPFSGPTCIGSSTIIGLGCNKVWAIPIRYFIPPEKPFTLFSLVI